ncbi:hypothetical protein ACSE3M_17680 [Bacillus velezensis]
MGYQDECYKALRQDIIAGPLMVLLTITIPLLTFLFCYAAAILKVVSGVGVLISIVLLISGETLGKGYGQEDIRAIIEGRPALPESRSKMPHKVNLVVDIQSRMRDGKGSAYERWAKIFNLKQMAAALQYLLENGLMEYEQLTQKAAEVTDRFYAFSDRIKTIEAAIRVHEELKAAVVDYAKTWPVFEDYKAAKYNRKYLTKHEADIAAYRAAQDTFRRLLSGAKLPKMDTLKVKDRELAAKKKPSMVSIGRQERTCKRL